MSSPANEQSPSDAILMYTALMTDAAAMSERRQNMNSIYLTLNGLFLTALGWLLITSHFTSWWTTGTVATLTLIVIPINRTWLHMLEHYQAWLKTRYQNLHDIEVANNFSATLFRKNTEQADQRGPLVGQNYISAKNKSDIERLSIGLAASSALEMSLPRYFLWVYPLITIGVFVISFLVIQHVLPTPAL